MRRLASISLLAASFLIGCRQSDEPVAPQGKQVQPPKAKMPDNEAFARKQRSMTRLRAEAVPTNEGLPIIETEAEAKFRTTEQAALRAMALCIVASRAEGLDEEMMKKLVADFKLDETLTPKEKKFIFNPKPSDHDRTQFVWRYECYSVLLWALGFVDGLETPKGICDVKRSVRILRDHGREEFLKKAKLRSKAEILDAADLIYRYHWAVRDAQLNSRKAPAGLEPGVVMERHYALNWLIGYLDQDWDDVGTDT
jgi:hypothetical protein